MTYTDRSNWDSCIDFNFEFDSVLVCSEFKNILFAYPKFFITWSVLSELFRNILRFDDDKVSLYLAI